MAKILFIEDEPALQKTLGDFLKAEGHATGNSLVEPDKLDEARRLRAAAGDKLVLPSDYLVADKMDASAQTQVINGLDIPDGWEGFDVGPTTVAKYAEIIESAGTVVWNGPVGKFEIEPFSHGTRGIAEAMARSKAVTVVGGGEMNRATSSVASMARSDGASDKRRAKEIISPASTTTLTKSAS